MDKLKINNIYNSTVHSHLKLALYFSAEHPNSPKKIRNLLGSLLKHRQPEAIEPVILATHEAICNCLRHAQSPYQVFLEEEKEAATVTVVDWGNSFFNGNAYIAPHPGNESGKLGVTMIKELMDEYIWHETMIYPLGLPAQKSQKEISGTTLVMKKFLCSQMEELNTADVFLGADVISRQPAFA